MKDEMAREQRPTAYVLGEMTPEERAAFEAEMETDAALAAEVAEIREMADLLSREMAAEQASLSPEMRARIENAASEEVAKAPPAPVIALPAAKRPFLRRASVWVAAAATLAGAAGLMLVSTARMRSKEASPAVVAYAPPAATATAASHPMDVTKPGQGVARLKAPADAPALVPGEEHARRFAFAAPPGEIGSANRFDQVAENPFLSPRETPLSTFSIDVDTASYSLVRTFLSGGNLPPAGAVRIEEMVNYFGYDYPEPESDVPFRVQLDLGVAPWAPAHKLVRVALKGKTVKLSAMDGVNLVFLVDTSGSMNAANKLPLLQQGFRMLVDKLGPNDRVAIVAYAGSAGLVLPSTPVSDRQKVLSALDRLSAGGSTNGGAGIDLAYKVAAENFLKGGVNRVILATDGDFNVGVTGNDALVGLIQEKAKTGVFLSVLGFGMGNFNDSLLEKIADKGNGQYAYIDDETEAKRALVDGLGGLVTIAKDVKIQIEFNPALVSGYRLIGYENRTMAARDFHDDKKDAGELGSGHTVTALYEITPATQHIAGPAGGGLKYQAPPAASAGSATGELLTVKLRYKEPDASESKLLERTLKDEATSLAQMPADFRFAAAVASFGMLLRKSPHAGNATFQSVLDLAEPAAGDDAKRREFVALIRKATAAGSPPAASAHRCAPGDPLCQE
jgi:Ca-activated chloride channel family protein